MQSSHPPCATSIVRPSGNRCCTNVKAEPLFDELLPEAFISLFDELLPEVFIPLFDELLPEVFILLFAEVVPVEAEVPFEVLPEAVVPAIALLSADALRVVAEVVVGVLVRVAEAVLFGTVV